MPVQISDYKTIPAIALNRVHVVELRINITEEQSPKAPVRVVYKLYGHDENDVRRWDPAQYVLAIDDAYTEAAANAGRGDFALMNALVAIESAIAGLVTKHGGHGTAERV